MNRLVQRVSETELFSEEYKDEIYNLLEDADDIDWYIFASFHLQNYCNYVLDDYNLYSELHLSSLPPNVVFYDTETDEEVYTEKLETYLIPIIEIWLEPDVTNQRFLNRLDELYQEMFGESW